MRQGLWAPDRPRQAGSWQREIGPGCRSVRADLTGIDPDKDVELTVPDGMLHTPELRYGSLSRSLPLPEGVTEADITATYKAGVLEIRIPEPKREPAKKIAVSKA